MIASRLLQIALDFVDDHSKMETASLLSATANLCVTRPPSSTPPFVSQSLQLRNKADHIIANTRFNTYPQVYMDYLATTPYAALLPSRIANFVKAGLTGDVSTTMSANEFNVVSQGARTAISELNTLANTLAKLNVKKISIPKDTVSIEFLLPRASFGNLAASYLEINAKIDSILIAYDEYVGSSERLPRLIFTSTTDPIVAFGVSVGAAYGVIQLINGVLEIVKRAIDLYSSIRLLKDRGVSPAAVEMEKQAEAITKADVEAMIETTFRTLKTETPPERQNELRNRISIHVVTLLPIIAEGAVLSISPESILSLEDLHPNLSMAESPTLMELQIENGKRNRDLQAVVRLNGGQQFLRLRQEPSPESD